MSKMVPFLRLVFQAFWQSINRSKPHVSQSEGIIKCFPLNVRMLLQTVREICWLAISFNCYMLKIMLVYVIFSSEVTFSTLVNYILHYDFCHFCDQPLFSPWDNNFKGTTVLHPAFIFPVPILTNA